MNTSEKKATFALAAIFAFRMLGLFMILPVFALYATHLAGANSKLIGIALGIYGLTQACLQIPFGMLSDKIGRKPVITAGLLLFAFGSIIAALSHSITGVILGRAFQGAGAIGSTILALTADLTREEQRTKAMALIGVTIGLSFTLAMALGSILNGWIGVPGIFWLTAGLALCGIIILHVIVPKPTTLCFHPETELEPAKLHLILKNPELLRLNFGIMALHAIFTAVFLVIPLILQQMLGINVNQQWLIYLPVLLLAFALALPFIILAEKKKQMKPVFLGAIFAIVIALGMILLGRFAWWPTLIGLFIFCTSFTLLEAMLPSWVSKIAPAKSKGTATGVYSFCQFFGIFLGGALGGWLLSKHNNTAIFIFSAAAALLWLVIASTMTKPKQVTL